MKPYTPTFVCEYCGKENTAYADLDKGQGLFVPCQCKEARANRDRQHYLEMERRKQARRRQR